MISAIHIIHYTKLSERKKHMLSEIKKWNLDNVPIEFEEQYDQEVISDYDIFNSIDVELFKSNTGREPLKGELSLCLKYKNILKKVSCMKDEEYVLILEDDVIFKEDPLLYIQDIIKKCENEDVSFDCVFMGEAAMRRDDDRNIFIKRPSEYWPSAPHTAPVELLKNATMTNGLCTVLYKVSSVKRVYNYLNNFKIESAMDWHMNSVFRNLKFDVYWAKAITKHGSVLAADDITKNSLRSSLRGSY
tara:strand:+ start:715 stop:1452 length:738 start_codon:yes stop_codon:yes gene_type:complete